MAKKIDVNGLDHYHDKVSAMLASEYSSSKTYAVGDYCFHAGTLYECTTAITTAENWTAGHWTAAKLAEDTSALKTAFTQEIDGIKTSLGYDIGYNRFNGNFTDGYWSGSTWTESTTNETSDMMDIPENGKLYSKLFNITTGEEVTNRPSYMQWIYWFDSSKSYIGRVAFTLGEITINANAKYFEIMVVKSTYNTAYSNGERIYVGGANVSSYVAYSLDGLPNYENIVDDIYDSIGEYSFSLSSQVYTIKANKAIFQFKHMTDSDINFDGWRLFSCYLYDDNGNSFKVWQNSDAEGVVRIRYESDFVGGYHGSEVATNIKVFLDGVDITAQTSYTKQKFKNLAFYVESNVYHCYQNTQPDVVAFKRCKIIEFENNMVKISNCFVAQGDMDIESARTALLSCDKGSNNEFSNYSVNSDFKIYSVADYATAHPEANEKMTEAELFTTFGNIEFLSILTSDQNYKGSVENLTSRLKFYFDTIATRTSVTEGEKIMSQFAIKFFA